MPPRAIGLCRFFRDSNLTQVLWLDRRLFAVSHERASLIIHRTQTLAFFLAGLTLAWVVVDSLDFDGPLWRVIAFERCVASAAFLGLALPRFARCPFPPELAAIAILFAIPLCFLLATERTFELFGAANPAIAGTTAYYYLPFIVAAGLSIFPLTVLESVACAVPILATMAISIWLWPAMLGASLASETLWRLLLIAGISGYSGICQLRLLINVTERASRDGMTGALTRQAGELLLEMEFARAARHGTPLAVAFIDLDHFKQVNDRFGHDTGDTVLVKAADQIHAALRRQDALVRWGGEEFLLVLSDTSAHDAEAVIERLGAAGLGGLPDGSIQTASIGIAERTADASPNSPSLVTLADERMYAAKQAGRNRRIDCAGAVATFCKQAGPPADSDAPARGRDAILADGGCSAQNR